MPAEVPAEMAAESYIGVDVGGGGIRVRALVGARPGKLRDHRPVPRIAGQIDAVSLGKRITTLLRDVVRDEPFAHLTRIAVGLTGMPGLLEHPRELAAVIHGDLPSDSVIIASDALTTHLGALAGRPGTVVAAGTGAITLGTDHAAAWNRVDGWGHLLGDDGGGAWIGARGLRAALRQGDGRVGGSGPLHDELRERYGDVASAVATIYGAPAPAHELASFAPNVARAAYAGDPVALDIWSRAGRALAEAAHAASRGIPPEFSWAGKLFDAGDILLAPFAAALRGFAPDATLSPPGGQAADGALLLARRGVTGTGGEHRSYALEFPVTTA